MQMLKCTLNCYLANFSKYKQSLHQAVTLVVCEITCFVSVFTYNLCCGLHPDTLKPLILL